MKWILLFQLIMMNGGGVTSFEMQTHAACEKAATKLLKDSRLYRAACIEKSTGDTYIYTYYGYKR